MLTRRLILASAPLLAATGARAQGRDSFADFLAGLHADARRAGISPATADRALSGLRPNPKVIELDHHQPEFTLTWEQYRARVLPDSRINEGRQIARREQGLLDRVSARYGVPPGIIMGIWGLESGFGQKTGGYNVVESLATLAWEGRRAAYFRGQTLNALRILDHRDISFERMTGSWAGAMGQPQFMPDSYLAYAVDFEGKGRRDIWTDRADVFASIANYLARSGWRAGEPWGQPVQVPAGFDAASAGRDRRRSLGEWMRAGVRRDDGSAFTRADPVGAVVLPDGPGGAAFMVYGNFAAIRRYNPSDFYALAVGLLGDAVTA